MRIGALGSAYRIRLRRLTGVAAFALALVGALLPSPAASQQGRATAAAVDFRTHPFGAVAVSAHPWGTAVAITVAIPAGSASDPRELPGAAWLLGEVVRDQVQARVEESGAATSVSVGRAETVYQVLALPGRWKDAYDALVETVFAAGGAFPTLEARRVDALETFRFESGAPVREFQGELFSLLGGSGSAWSRDPRGSMEAMERIRADDLADLKRAIYRRQDAVVTLVGALDTEPGVLLYPGTPAGGDGDGGPGSRGRGAGPAWDRGERERLVRPVTNAWIGAAFPAPRTVPRTILEFIQQRLIEEFNPTPRDPGLYGTDVRLEDLPDGPVLILEAAILVDDQARWEDRIRRALEGLGTTGDQALFDLYRRRFRNLTLTGEGAPEAEGRRMAADLLRDGRVRDLPSDIARLGADQVERSIESLGEPRMLIFGPSLDGGR